MTLEKSEQEKFLVAKMVERVKVLKHENELFGKKLEDPNLSDKDFDLYQGLVDNNIGEQKAYRRMEDNLREWRENQKCCEGGPQWGHAWECKIPKWHGYSDAQSVQREPSYVVTGKRNHERKCECGLNGQTVRE